MRQDIKIMFYIIVCIIFLILVSLVGSINPDSEIFMIMYLFSLGILIAILSLIMLEKFITGMIYTGVYVTVNYLIIFILIPFIEDLILKTPTIESIGLSELIMTPIIFIYLPMLFSNIVSFFFVFGLGKFILKIKNKL